MEQGIFQFKADESLIIKLTNDMSAMLGVRYAEFHAVFSRLSIPEKTYLAYLYLGESRHDAAIAAKLADDIAAESAIDMAALRVESMTHVSTCLSIMQGLTVDDLILTATDRQVLLSQIAVRCSSSADPRMHSQAISAINALNKMTGTDDQHTGVMEQRELTEEEQAAFMEKLKEI